MSTKFRMLALIWGIVWACLLQFTRWGRWLALYRTWITVVVGVGVDLIILLFLLPRSVWGLVLETIGLSAVGLIARSLWNEFSQDAN